MIFNVFSFVPLILIFDRYLLFEKLLLRSAYNVYLITSLYTNNILKRNDLYLYLKKSQHHLVFCWCVRK